MVGNLPTFFINKYDNMENLQKILKMSHQIQRVDKLGGRDSLFGMMEIFEIILQEEHEKDPN